MSFIVKFVQISKLHIISGYEPSDKLSERLYMFILQECDIKRLEIHFILSCNCVILITYKGVQINFNVIRSWI